MKYHKIRSVPLGVCTAEQKVAYNLAFRVHIGAGDEYKKEKERSAIAASSFLILWRDMLIEEFKRQNADGKYDIDAVFAALDAGLETYLEKPFIASNYMQIGEAFPALYLHTAEV